MTEPMDFQTTECACGNTHEPMTYCAAFLTPFQSADMQFDEVDDVTETDTIETMEDFPPPPPPMQRQIACEDEPPPPPLQRQNAHRVSVRDQELQFIEEHGLVAFCNTAMITAILQDADYLRAQLIYLGKQ